MKVIFLSSFFPDNLLSEIQKNSKANLDNAGNSLQWHLLKGLSRYLSSLEVINAPHIGSFPLFYKWPFVSGEVFLIEQRIIVTSLGYLNLAIIKNRIIETYLKKTLKQKLSSLINTEIYIIIYGMRGPFIKAAVDAKKNSPNIKLCLIVPDLQEHLGNSTGLMWTLRLAMQEDLKKYINHFDCFVVLTEAMVESLGIENKPWIRIEGMINPAEHETALSTLKEQTKKIILYTGTLAERYGILDLLEAFELINDNNYELWICGAGNTEKQISDKAKANNAIKYFGIVDRKEALRLQQIATVLINPRSIFSGEYTKFSFPSKTLEYLLSGKPVVMRKLPGVPEEYNQYLFFTDDQSVASLKNKIIEICELSLEKREEIGCSGREFVIKQKNYFMQTEKIIKFLQKL